MTKKELKLVLSMTLEIVQRLQEQLDLEIESKDMWREDYKESVERRVKQKEEWEAAQELSSRLEGS